MRLIDADALIKLYRETADDEWMRKSAPGCWSEAYMVFIADVACVPTVEQPKIVRCKDCKYAKMTIDGDFCKYCELDEDENGFLREVYHDAEWFCADGEVKQDE